MKEFLLKKETIDTIKFVGLLILIFVVINLVVTYIPPFNKYDIFAVQTDSMDPVIAPGDIVVTKEIPYDEIKIGDIMAFRVDITNDGKDDVVVHYVDEINTYNDELIFKTKPHVSDLQDRWTIEQVDIIGIFQYQINGLGKVLLFAQSWVGRIVILFDIIIISVLYDYLFAKPKETEKESEEPQEENKEDKEKISTE